MAVNSCGSVLYSRNVPERNRLRRAVLLKSMMRDDDDFRILTEEQAGVVIFTLAVVILAFWPWTI